MAREMERGSSVGVQLLSCAGLLAFCSRCVSADAEPLATLPLCVAQEGAAAPAASVVQVRADLGPAGGTLCSGIVVAARVVVTNLLCVVMPPLVKPSDLEDAAGEAPPAFLGGVLYSADIDYAGSCQSDATWSPREDGAFSAWLGEPLDPARITVTDRRDDRDLATATVRRVLLPNAESRCWDTLAALVLEEPLSTAVLPVRLEEASRIGDPVTLAGFGISSETPYELSTSIEAITFEAADSAAPPRSLLLKDQICVYETGGPLVSDETGELIGVIGYGTGDACGDPEGRTIATRIAPFRRLLLDAADAATELLRTMTPPSSELRETPLCLEP